MNASKDRGIWVVAQDFEGEGCWTAHQRYRTRESAEFNYRRAGGDVALIDPQGRVVDSKRVPEGW